MILIMRSTPSYQFQLAKTALDFQAYFALRHSIFVEEQGVFTRSDADNLDAVAYPIIATQGSEVVGIVRIYESEPRLWYGGRLGVHVDHRRAAQVGKGLIYKAVTTANAWGCDRFLATVQIQNVRFFQRQHWNSLEEIDLCGRPHHLMKADLNYYPSSTELRPILSYLNQAVS
jgi:putative N-acetyltransferase (TIGR04045 family)